MSLSDFDPDQLDRVVRRQRQGADVRASAWVSASAGAGKTRVLRDRVLRLLLAGVAPQRLLCLTFTKAAAAEMARRINDELGAWTIVGDGELHESLKTLLGREADERERRRARRLFARVLETPGGMKIMTIHAFCQSVLRRFPLEAGVAPHFRVLEERDADELLKAVKAELLADAHAQGGALGAAVADVAARVHETRFPELMGEISRSRAQFAEVLLRLGGPPGIRGRLAEFLGIAAADTPKRVLKSLCRKAEFDALGLRRAAAALAQGSIADQARAAAIESWVAGPISIRVETFDDYAKAYLTQKGDVRATLATRQALAADPGIGGILEAEAARIAAGRDRLRKADLLAANGALAHIAVELIRRYEARKAAGGRLDYDDLISRTRALLRGDGTAAWVLFKLDGGIDHVLIDEAQDTNPRQWDVVLALVEEFFAGGSGRDEDVLHAGLPARSVFAVGDAKQSIYSFQGADPARFEQVRGYLERRARDAGRNWENVPLDFSFRSARPILEAVDRVFAAPEAGDGVADPDPENPVRHTPLREAAAGRVELWPPVTVERLDEPEPWKPPVDPVSQPNAMERLAGLIAERTADWLAGGETLESRGRPMRADDIMVLVRQRGTFVETLVRAFKARGVPVAGVDRMVLSEQIAVMDLLALGGFLLLPDDDLTLATVLKSPLVGFDEDRLFDLAHGRGGRRLWRALRDRRAETEDFARAHDWLAGLLARVDFERPHELYAGVLERGARERLFARLGPDAADPLDEFLSLALAYERGHAPSLQGFLHWVAAGQVEIKRDLDQTGGAVRVMSVHGAKGLEAPVVFLPDTTSLPRKMPNVLWRGESRDPRDPQDPFFVWLPRAGDADDRTGALREEVQRRRDQEYRRLLYVAMTRAQERLYVCGWNEPGEGSWYGLVRPAIEKIAQPFHDPLLERFGIGDPTVLRLEAEQRGEVAPEAAADADASDAMPPWIARPAPPEPTPARPLAPSDPGEEPPVRSPVGDEDASHFVRGNLLHRLLQWLPGLPADARRAAAERYLARPALALDTEMRRALADEAMGVLEAPSLAHLFGPDGMSEVAVTGTAVGPGGAPIVIAGQIDRLVLGEGTVEIVDYKSNRSPASRPQDVSPSYLRQMAAYRHVIARTWPDREVRCFLLWTESPRLMGLPDRLLDDYVPVSRRDA